MTRTSQRERWSLFAHFCYVCLRLRAACCYFTVSKVNKVTRPCAVEHCVTLVSCMYSTSCWLGLTVPAFTVTQWAMSRKNPVVVWARVQKMSKSHSCPSCSINLSHSYQQHKATNSLQINFDTDTGPERANATVVLGVWMLIILSSTFENWENFYMSIFCELAEQDSCTQSCKVRYVSEIVCIWYQQRLCEG